MALLDNLIGFVAPHACLVCGREGGLLCTWCRHDALPRLPSQCYRCHTLTDDFSVCQKCRKTSRLKHVWIRTNYSQLARLLIHKYKFQHARSAAIDIARQMIQDLPYFVDTVLVPIPTATSRVRQRGFDHTKLLSRELGQLLRLEAKLLLKRTGQSQQVGTQRTQRTKQVAGIFAARNAVKGKKILLIDDVVTTGATLEETARVLIKAGATQVDAAIFAQAL